MGEGGWACQSSVGTDRCRLCCRILGIRCGRVVILVFTFSGRQDRNENRPEITGRLETTKASDATEQLQYAIVRKRYLVWAMKGRTNLAHWSLVCGWSDELHMEGEYGGETGRPAVPARPLSLLCREVPGGLGYEAVCWWRQTRLGDQKTIVEEMEEQRGLNLVPVSVPVSVSVPLDAQRVQSWQAGQDV